MKSITTLLDPVSPDDFYGQLLTYEARLKYNQPPTPNISANLTTKQQPSSSPQGGRGFRGSRGRGFRGCGRACARGGRFDSPYLDNHSLCQVCFEPRHTAHVCYNRLNQASQAPPSPAVAAHYLSTMPSAPQDSNWYPDNCNSSHDL